LLHETLMLFFVVLLQEMDMERLDPRGRTPLELAVCLGHLESTRVLLRYSANPTHCNAQSWTSEYEPFISYHTRISFARSSVL